MNKQFQIPTANGGDGGLTLAIAGQGYFWGQGVSDSAIGGTATIISPTGVNNVLVFQFVLPYGITIRNVTFLNGTTVVGASTASFGIYSIAGNKLLDSGAFSTAVASQSLTNAVTAVTLPANAYWFAQASTNSTVTSALNVLGFTSTQPAARNLNVTRQGVAANAYAGGLLPSTLGAITPFSNRIPVAVLFEA